jgi:long-chain fatty acid transport protein
MDLAKSQRRNFSTARILLLLPLIAAGTLDTRAAQASGYQLREASAAAMGSAYAGAAATDTDASFQTYNPASIAGVGSADFTVSAIGILPNSSANYTSATTSAGTPAGGALSQKDFVGSALVPDLAARVRLSPRWTVGLAVFSPWGLITDYREGWAGRYYAMKTQLLTLNISPSVAYQVSDHFAVSAGFQEQYAKGALTSAIDMGTIGAVSGVPGSIPGAQDGFGNYKADSWASGFTLSAMGEVTQDVTLGLSYRSAITHKMQGTLAFTPDSAGVAATINALTGLFATTQAATVLTTPDTIEFGGRARLSDRWTGLFEVDWTNWSRFRELRVVADNPVQPDDVTAMNWKDSWFVSLGAEFSPNPRWTLRTGAAYDDSPADNATFGPRLPDAARTWIAAGLTYHASDAIDIALSASHLFLPRESVDLSATQPGNALRGNLMGSTETNANVVGLQVSYRFGS